MQSAKTRQPQEVERRTQVRVRASEVVRLWAGPSVLSELQARHTLQRKAVRIAAVRADQRLSLEDYEVLEDSGIWVVQIPADAPSSSSAEVARYLTDQLSAGSEATAERMAALGTAQNFPDAAEHGHTVVLRKEEEEFLEFLNDPANQLGAP